MGNISRFSRRGTYKLMGIRIKKRIAWVKAYHVDELDELLPNLKEVKNNKLHKLKGEDYFKYLDDNFGQHIKNDDFDKAPMDALMWSDKFNSIPLYDCVAVLDSDEGVGGTADLGEDYVLIALTPLTQLEEWFRWDDTIDYVEASQQSIETNSYATETKIRFLSYPPTPYEGHWMNQRTGQEIPIKDFDVIRFLKNSYVDNKNVVNEKSLERIGKYGFENFDDLIENMVPSVPESIRLMVKWLDFMPEQELITYKPAIVTYWN